MVKPVGCGTVKSSQPLKRKLTFTPKPPKKQNTITNEAPPKTREHLLALSNQYSVRDAAKLLGMPLKKFRSLLKTYAIFRWPYRTVKNAGADKEMAGCAAPNSKIGNTIDTRAGDATQQHNVLDIKDDDDIPQGDYVHGIDDVVDFSPEYALLSVIPLASSAQLPQTSIGKRSY